MIWNVGCNSIECLRGMSSSDTIYVSLSHALVLGGSKMCPLKSTVASRKSQIPKVKSKRFFLIHQTSSALLGQAYFRQYSF